MADERHEWLDGDAAERLLRGEGAEPGDERARAEAAELAGLLRSLRGPEQATTELPGEAAALAAFREARAGSASATADEALGVVRIGHVKDGAGVAAPRRRRFAPVRLGIAAAVACCTLGGVAVAAGTGVLPGPFASDEQDPTPASTVSADLTPSPLDASPSHPLPSGSPAPGRPTPSVSAPTHDAGPSGTQGAPSAAASPDRGTDDGTRQGGSGDSDENAGGGQWLARTAEDCRDYRSGRLDQDKRRDLESAAHGPAAVKAFCDLLLDDKGGAGGGGAKGGSGGGSDGGKGGKHGGADGGKGKGDGAGNKNGGGGGGKQNSMARPGPLLGLLTPTLGTAAGT